MLGLHSHIRVTVIRNAAGSRCGPVAAGSQPRAITYQTPSNISLVYPSATGANIRDLYDITRPRKVINVMNFYGAPSADFVAFSSDDLDSPVALDCELKAGDEIIIIWKPLLALRREFLTGTGNILPSKIEVEMTTCKTDQASIKSIEGDPIYRSEKGRPHGAATLDANGNVPLTQLGNVPLLELDSIYLGEKGKAGGSATLDDNGNVPLSQLGNVTGAFFNTFEVIGIGRVVRITGNNSVSLAQGDSVLHARVAGISKAAFDNSCPGEVITVLGTIVETAQLETGLSPVAGDEVFLSTTVAGALTTIEPTASGDVIMKVGIVKDTAGYIGGTLPNSRVSIIYQPSIPQLII